MKKRDGNIMVLVWKKHTFSADIPKELNLKIIYQRMDLKTAYSRGGAGICEMGFLVPKSSVDDED